MNHVIHYHLPARESEFVHRNGRTARMHTSGTVRASVVKTLLTNIKNEKMKGKKYKIEVARSPR